MITLRVIILWIHIEESSFHTRTRNNDTTISKILKFLCHYIYLIDHIDSVLSSSSRLFITWQTMLSSNNNKNNDDGWGKKKEPSDTLDNGGSDEKKPPALSILQEGTHCDGEESSFLAEKRLIAERSRVPRQMEKKLAPRSSERMIQIPSCLIPTTLLSMTSKRVWVKCNCCYSCYCWPRSCSSFCRWSKGGWVGQRYYIPWPGSRP